jgi:serine/threonine-protein kinase
MPVNHPITPPSLPQITLRALGTIALTDGDGRPIENAMGRPKQMAALFYILLAEPRGVHRRDTLLALLWPELSEERARIALNKATHAVRKLLGADVIVRPTDQELVADPQVIGCDALDFVDAAAAGDHARALDLYQGELLAGLHVGDAPAFMQWLDERRLAFRRQAVASALAVAHQERHSNPARALECARRARDIDPFAEDALRAELLLLDARGDRAQAMREVHAFAERLAAEYDTEPAPETLELVNAIRGRSEANTVDRFTPPPLNVADAPRRPRRWAVGAALVVVLAAGGFVAARGSGPTLDRATVEAAEAGTKSPEALAAYMDGERAYRAGSFTASVEAFKRAAEGDREFALAWWKLSMAARWAGAPGLVQSSFDRARQLSARLPDEARMHLLAQQLYDSAQYQRALAVFEQVIARQPRDVDALASAAEVRFHFGDPFGWPTAASEEYWRRVIELRPRDAGALIHLVEIAAMAGDRAAFERWSSQLRPDSLDVDRRVLVRVMRAFVFGDSLARTAAVADLALASPAERDALFQRVAAAAPDPHAFARLVVPVMLAHGSQRAWVYQCAVWLAAGAGRTDEVRALIDSGAAVIPDDRWVLAGTLIALPHLEFGRGWSLAALDSLSRMQRPGGRLPLWTYVEGAASLRLGDRERGARGAQLLERTRFTPPDSAIAVRLARLLRADMALAAGETRRALELLGPPVEPLDYRMEFPVEHDRLLRAEIAERQGNLTQARAWYATFPDQGLTDVSLVAWARYRQGMVEERLGDSRAAQAQYERARAALRDADGGARAFRERLAAVADSGA